MSTTKHTPGPWRLDKRGNTYIVDKPGDGYITRDVCRMDSSTMSAFHQEGNAFLIAAAPDLLEALTKLVEDLEMRSNWKRGAENGVVDCGNSVYRNARTAIAKATGQG